MNKINITIDPGHIKGYNVGVNKVYAEGTAMFNLAYYLKDYLESTGIFNVYVTRSKVTDNPDLATRGKMAITTKSKVFISLHSNAFSAESAKGVITFYSCKRPNSLTLGKNLTNAIVSTMKANTGTTYSRGCEFKKNSAGNDYYGVIRAAAASSTVEYIYLIEHGFHTNKAECNFLVNDANLKKLAKAEADVLYAQFKTSVDAAETPTNSGSEYVQGSKFIVSKAVAGYSTASDAKAGTNKKTTLAIGTYYVYRTYSNGMINITKTIGGTTPGAWINPTDATSNTTDTSSDISNVVVDTSKLTKLTMDATNNPICTPSQAVNYLRFNNPSPKLNCTPEELVYAFVRAGFIENIRWDIAFAQSIKETGFFKYGGQVLWNQNNFAGIGATNGGAAGATFKTPFLGALAQMQHLKVYANTDPIEWKETVDPRFNLVSSRGYAPYVEWLGAKDNPKNTGTKSLGWAVPGEGYGLSILSILSKIAATKG